MTHSWLNPQMWNLRHRGIMDTEELHRWKVDFSYMQIFYHAKSQRP